MRGLMWVLLWLAVFAAVTLPFGEDGTNPLWMCVATLIAWFVTGWLYESTKRGRRNVRAHDDNASLATAKAAGDEDQC